MLEEIGDACYYGQMKDYNYERMSFEIGLIWTNYEYHELLAYLNY